jgi:hypothetical protein
MIAQLTGTAFGAVVGWDSACLMLVMGTTAVHLRHYTLSLCSHDDWVEKM